MITLQTKLTLLIIVSAACLASSIIVPVIPSISIYYAMEENQPNLLMSTYLFGYLLGQIIYSFLSKHKSPKIALQIGFLIFILGSIIQIYSFYNRSIGLLFLGRFTSSLGASSGLVCVFAIINEKFPINESKKLISLAFISLASFSYISIVLSSIITNYIDWKIIFYIILMISILYFFLVNKNIPSFELKYFENQRNKKISYISYYLSSLKNLKLILASMIVAFTTTTTYLYNSTASLISTNYFHFSPNYFGIYSLLNFIGLIMGGYISSILIKKYNPINVVFFGMSIAALPIIAFICFTNIILQNENCMFLFFILTAILNVSLGVIYPSGSYIALNSLECNSTASSIMNFIKIGCPAVVLSISSQTKLSTINSFEIPLYSSFVATLIFLFFLYVTESQPIMKNPFPNLSL
jgi:MFS transporter, DHA1 family, multidrug resistance protein